MEKGGTMDYATFTEFITSVGFPIACVIAMFYLLNREQEEHKAEVEKWTEAINNNTSVMTRLIERLDKDENK